MLISLNGNSAVASYDSEYIKIIVNSDNSLPLKKH